MFGEFTIHMTITAVLVGKEIDVTHLFVARRVVMAVHVLGRIHVPVVVVFKETYVQAYLIALTTNLVIQEGVMVVVGVVVLLDSLAERV